MPGGDVTLRMTPAMTHRELGQFVVDCLHGDRLVLQDFRHSVARGENIGVPEHHERARRWAVDETSSGFEHRNACAF